MKAPEQLQKYFLFLILLCAHSFSLVAGDLSAVSEAFYMEGMKLAKTDPKEAYQKFSQALQEGNPAWNHLADCFFQRGVLLFDKADIPNATQDFSLAVQADKNHFNAYLFLGKCYFMLRKNQECLQTLQLAEQLDPKNAEVHYIWARMLMTEVASSGEVLEASMIMAAMEHFDEAINFNKKYTEAYYYRALAKEAINDSKQAIKDLQRAIKIDPQLYRAWYEMSQVYLSMKLPEKALESLEECLRIQAFIPAYQSLLSLCQELKEDDKLERYLSEALKLYPANLDFKKLRAIYKIVPKEKIPPTPEQPLLKKSEEVSEKKPIPAETTAIKPAPPLPSPKASEFPEENWY
jgi:tetratricopeptide (TPR) repeat protein